jgi:hypothetical protein
MYILILAQEIVWAAFLATLSQTHPVTLLPGDQVGRIFAYIYLHICIGRLYTLAVFNAEAAQTFGQFFHFLHKLCVNFDKNCFGFAFWRFFDKLIRSPCPALRRRFLHENTLKSSLPNTSTITQLRRW